MSGPEIGAVLMVIVLATLAAGLLWPMYKYYSKAKHQSPS